MRSLRPLILAAILTLVSPALALADTIYAESMSGDLDFPGSLVLTLSAGDNTVTGTTSYSTSGQSDQDGFQFIVPAGYLVSSINLVFDTDASPDGSSSSISWFLSEQTPTGNLYVTPLLSVTGTGSTQLLPAFVPAVSSLPPNTYLLNTNGFSSTGSSFSTDYKLTLNVTAVPDSASTFGMLGFVFAGLGAARHWRARLAK